MKTNITAILIIMIFSGCNFSLNKKEKVNRIKVSTDNIPEAMADQWQLLGEAVNEPGWDIWGSSPIRDEEGNVHLFCARWQQNVPWETAWRYHSEIAHYIGKKPEGPFHIVDVIGKGKGEGHWNAVGFHNPGIKKIDGKYVLVYISNDGSPNHGPNQKIGMLISDDLNGPWKEIPNEHEPLLSPPADSSVWCHNSGCGVNNPALLKHPDGRYFLYFKSMSGPRPEGKVKMGLAIADQLEGPYIIQPHPITSNNQAIEDGYAFFWRNHICLLTTDNHGILEKGGGLLWLSEDGINFDPKPLPGFHHLGNYYYNGKLPETAVVRYTKQAKFERPQILMGINGDPEYLYCPSGVALDGSDGTNCYLLKYQQKD